MSNQPPFDGRPCPMCPVETRNLYAVAHNLLCRWDDRNRRHKVPEEMEELRRAVEMVQPLADAHFADRGHWHSSASASTADMETRADFFEAKVVDVEAERDVLASKLEQTTMERIKARNERDRYRQQRDALKAAVRLMWNRVPVVEHDYAEMADRLEKSDRALHKTLQSVLAVTGEWDKAKSEVARLQTERDRYFDALARIGATADPKRGHLAELSDRQMIARYALMDGATPVVYTKDPKAEGGL